jgi:threonylcarbamoyladenosine tRNA methylthiotransferase MtaB
LSIKNSIFSIHQTSKKSSILNNYALYLQAMSENDLKKLSVTTIGCRLNQYESEKMAAELYPYGFQRVKEGERADLYLINTCTVTHRADSNCRNYIRRAARQNPNGNIVVTGCYVDNDPEKIAGMEGVDIIVKNAEKNDITNIIPQKLPDLFNREPDKNCSTLVTDFYDRNRAWLKVSDGCNQWCSFCIIPTVRGRIKNRPALEIINEINSLVEHGYKEVVLTGVHIGHYRNRKIEPQMKNLAALCKFIFAETDLYRLRISSIEPQTVRDEFVEMYGNSNGRICQHIHLPLQSGSSRILQLMRRPYDQKTYIKRATALKTADPDTTIGADVIVGFPGETEDDFLRTCRVAESGLIDYLHVFSYSDRPDTDASKLPDKVNPKIIKKRNAILTRISNKIREQSNNRQIGKTLEVISQHKREADGSFFGVSGNYVKVQLPSSIMESKEIVKVKITDANLDYVAGDIIVQQ